MSGDCGLRKWCDDQEGLTIPGELGLDKKEMNAGSTSLAPVNAQGGSEPCLIKET